MNISKRTQNMNINKKTRKNSQYSLMKTNINVFLVVFLVVDEPGTNDWTEDVGS